MRVQARVIDSRLEPRFRELMLGEKWYASARYAYALAVSHRARRNYKASRQWGNICLSLLRLCTIGDWGRDNTPVALGGIDVPAPIYPRLVRKNLWWLLATKEGKTL